MGRGPRRGDARQASGEHEHGQLARGAQGPGSAAISALCEGARPQPAVLRAGGRNAVSACILVRAGLWRTSAASRLYMHAAGGTRWTRSRAREASTSRSTTGTAPSSTSRSRARTARWASTRSATQSCLTCRTGHSPHEAAGGRPVLLRHPCSRRPSLPVRGARCTRLHPCLPREVHSWPGAAPAIKVHHESCMSQGALRPIAGGGWHAHSGHAHSVRGGLAGRGPVV